MHNSAPFSESSPKSSDCVRLQALWLDHLRILHLKLQRMPTRDLSYLSDTGDFVKEQSSLLIAIHNTFMVDCSRVLIKLLTKRAHSVCLTLAV